MNSCIDVINLSPQLAILTGFYVCLKARRPGARFSKLPVIAGPVKHFCFPLQMGVSKGLKIIQLSYRLKKQTGLYLGFGTREFRETLKTDCLISRSEMNIGIKLFPRQKELSQAIVWRKCKRKACDDLMDVEYALEFNNVCLLFC